MAFKPEFERFFSHTPALMAVANTRGHFVWINDSWDRIVGYGAEKLLTQPYHNFVHPDDIEQTSSTLSRKAAAGEEVINTINRYRHRDGHWIYLEWNITVDPENQLLYGIANDVTMIVGRNKLLKASQERFELAVAGSNDGLWDWDIEADVMFYSDRCKAMLGYGDDTPEDKLELWLDAIHDDDRAMAEAALAGHLKNRLPYAIEHRLMCQNGELRWFLTKGQAIWNDKGEATRMAGSLSDIHERKLHEVELLRARKKAEEASNAKSVFLANMSHELRTPLNSIIGFSNRIIRKADDSIPEKMLVGVDAIYRNGQYLLALVNSLLDLAKVEAGMMDLKRQAQSINVLIEDVDAQLGALARQKMLSIKFTLETEHEKYNLDYIKVKQILINLISNAIKFTEKGYIETVFSDALMPGFEGSGANARCLKIEVIDTGLGLSPEDCEIIFDKFVQGGGNSAVQGTGIGLTLVKEFVKLHGGQVSVSSELGTGSVFTVWLGTESA